MFDPFNMGSLFMMAGQQPDMLAQIMGGLGIPPPTSMLGGPQGVADPGLSPYMDNAGGGGFLPGMGSPPLQAPKQPNPPTYGAENLTGFPPPADSPLVAPGSIPQPGFSLPPGPPAIPAPGLSSPVGVAAAPSLEAAPLPGGPEDVNPLALAGAVSPSGGLAGAPSSAAAKAPGSDALRGLALAGQALKGASADTRPQFTGGVTPQRETAPAQVAGGANAQSAAMVALLQSLIGSKPVNTTPSLGALLGR